MQMEPGVLHWQFRYLGQYWGAVMFRNGEILLVKSKYTGLNSQSKYTGLNSQDDCIPGNSRFIKTT